MHRRPLSLSRSSNKTKVATPFKLSDLVDSEELKNLGIFINHQGGLRKLEAFDRREVMKHLLAEWVYDQITRNYNDGPAILRYLSIANEIIKEMHVTPSPIIGKVFPKDPKDFNADTEGSCSVAMNLREFRLLYENFSKFLDERVAQSLKEGLPLVPTLEFVKNILKDELSEKIVKLYAKVASSQDLTLQEVKKEIPPRATTPVTPKTPVARDPNNIRTFTDYATLGKFFVNRKHTQLTITSALSSAITKREVFEYILTNWVFYSIKIYSPENGPTNSTYIQAMLRVAFEAAEGMDKEISRKAIFSEINEMMQRSHNMGRISEGNTATVGDMYVLLNHTMPYLQNKLIERIAKKESIIDSLQGKTELSKLIHRLLIASATLRTTEEESKIPRFASYDGIDVSLPQSSFIETIRKSTSFKHLQQQLLLLTIHTQGLHYPVTQADILNYLMLYWVVNFFTRQDTPKDQNSILKMLETAYQANLEICQVKSRTELLKLLSPMPSVDKFEKEAPGGLENRAIYLSEMHGLMLGYPDLLTRRLSKAPRNIEQQTLSPMPDRLEANISETQNNIKRIIAELHTAVKSLEFKAEPQQAEMSSQLLRTPKPVDAPENAQQANVNEEKTPIAGSASRRASSPPPPPPPLEIEEEENENAEPVEIALLEEQEDEILIPFVTRQLATASYSSSSSSASISAPATRAPAPPPPPRQAHHVTPVSSSPNSIFNESKNETPKPESNAVKENQPVANKTKKTPPPPPPSP